MSLRSCPNQQSAGECRDSIPVNSQRFLPAVTGMLSRYLLTAEGNRYHVDAFRLSTHSGFAPIAPWMWQHVLRGRRNSQIIAGWRYCLS